MNISNFCYLQKGLLHSFGIAVLLTDIVLTYYWFTQLTILTGKIAE